MIKIKTLFCIGIALFFSANAFSQWTALTSGTTNTLKSISFPSSSTGYAVGASGTIIKTINSGSAWSTLTVPGFTQNFNKVLFIDDNIGLVFGDGGKIYKTTDGGSNWTQKTSNTNNALNTAFLFNNNTTIFVGGEQATLLKSTDAGETWSTVAYTDASTSGAVQSIRTISFDEATNTVGYFGGDNSVNMNIYRSSDAGSTWSAQSITGATVTNFFGLSVVDATHSFICGGSSTILKTVNGTAWTSANSSLFNFYRACLFTSSTSGYLVGQGGGIIKTTNGTAFTSEASTVTTTLNSIIATDCGVMYVVGNGGVILKKAGSGSTSGSVDTYSTDQTGILTISAANGVLANDGQTGATVAVNTTTSNGTLILNADGSFTYSPNACFIGDDSFTYTISGGPCGGTSAPVNVAINSTATPINITGVADTYTNNSASITVTGSTGVISNDAQTGVTATVTSTTSHGVLVLNPDGSFTYTQTAGYVGDDSFTYTLTDACSNTSTPITATITNTFAATNGISINKSDDLKIFNDFAENKLYIKSSSVDLAKIQIYNSIGVLVLSEKINSNQKTINLQNLTSGIYTVYLNDSNNELYTQKIIKL